MSARFLEEAREIAFCDDAVLNPIIMARDGICEPPCRLHAAIASALASAHARGVEEGIEKLREPVLKILEGFDNGIFIRDISRDHETGWAMRLLPYTVAVMNAARALRPGAGQKEGGE